MNDIIRKVEFTLIIKSKMSNFKKLLVRIAAPAVVALPALSAFAQTSPPALTPRTDVDTIEEAKTAVVTWGNLFAGVIALIAVIMIIYGGYLYVTAGTNEDNTKKAKGILVYAVIGLAIAVFAYVIVNVVINFFLRS